MLGAFLSVLIILSGAQVRADEPIKPEAAFATLSELAGRWKRAGSDGTQFRIEFELTANGTVLVERWVHRERASSKATSTG